MAFKCQVAMAWGGPSAGSVTATICWTQPSSETRSSFSQGTRWANPSAAEMGK